MITEKLLGACAATFDSVEQFLCDGAFRNDEPSREVILASLQSVTEAEARSASSERMFRFHHSHLSPTDQDLMARIKVLAPTLHRRLLLRRRQLLCDVNNTRPAPYGHEALADIHIDEDRLAPLAAFDTECRVPVRNGYVFRITPSLPAPNSSFWSWDCLLRLSKEDVTVSFRPDPLSVQSAARMRVPFFKMLVYGRDLDWDRIAGLRDEEHTRWQPDDINGEDVAFTEASWTPREDGVHVAMEELPSASDCELGAARYLHGIYDASSAAFIHCDGAVRYYTLEELKLRRQTRLGRAGKAGLRVKLFRVDGSLARDEWCQLAASFFVWNDDINHYLTR